MLAPEFGGGTPIIFINMSGVSGCDSSFDFNEVSLTGEDATDNVNSSGASWESTLWYSMLRLYRGWHDIHTRHRT